MYHHDQESFVLNIIGLIVGFFHGVSILLLMIGNYNMTVIFVIVFNIVIVFSVYKYAKWVYPNLQTNTVIRKQITLAIIPISLIIIIWLVFF